MSLLHQCFCWGFFAAVGLLQAAPPPVVWPTPNPAFAEGKGLEEFIQPTGSGAVDSGLYGNVRNDGTRFHEGIDLKALHHDRRHESTDQIYAVMPGTVRHVSRRAADSSYGIYIVLEHLGVEPSVYTLYSHLRDIAPEIRSGLVVDAGTLLGRMGRTASGYSIPQERAHLHFEIGLRLTNQFQAWFDDQDFGSDNDHGIWNGMNLVGLDPLRFFEGLRSGQYQWVSDFIHNRAVALAVRVRTSMIPDFVLRYPSMLVRPVEARPVVGWDVTFDAYGVPMGFEALYEGEISLGTEGSVEIRAWNRSEVERTATGRDLVELESNGRLSPGELLSQRLALLFQP